MTRYQVSIRPLSGEEGRHVGRGVGGGGVEAGGGKKNGFPVILSGADFAVGCWTPYYVVRYSDEVCGKTTSHTCPPRALCPSPILRQPAGREVPIHGGEPLIIANLRLLGQAIPTDCPFIIPLSRRSIVSLERSDMVP